VNPAESIKHADVRRLYWWSFFARFAAGMVGWGMMYFTKIQLVVDAAYYDRVAASVANDWLAGRSSTWLELNAGNSAQPVLLIILLSSFYVLTLGVRALPLLIGLYCLITAWAPVWYYHVTLQLGASHRAALFAGRTVAFVPAFIFWSAALYKEGLILLLMGILLYQALQFQRSNNIASLMVVLVCLSAIGSLRFYLFPLLGLVFCAVILFPGRGISGAMLAVRLGVMIPLLGMVALIGVAAFLMVDDRASSTFGEWKEATQSQMPNSVEDAIRRIDLSRRDLANSRSGYLPDVRLNSIKDTVTFLPKGIAYFLFLPLPWHIGDIRQNMAIPDTALWLLVFYPLFLVGLLRLSLRDPSGVILLLFPALAMCCLYGLFIGNIGTAYRMRTQVWILLVPFVAIGWETLQGRNPFWVSNTRVADQPGFVPGLESTRRWAARRGGRSQRKPRFTLRRRREEGRQT